MSEKSSLKKLYSKIPSFECIEGCTDCCGPVPLTKLEAKRLNVDSNLTPTKLGSCDCVYASEKGCTVYENRPYMCRLFGATEDLKCPHGKKPTKLLSSDSTNRLTNDYRKLESINVKNIQEQVGQFVSLNEKTS